MDIDLTIGGEGFEGISAVALYNGRGELLGYRWFAFYGGGRETGDACNKKHALHRAERRLEIMREQGPR